ncbi:Gfo/Idh/MocA family protein [Pseudooceanicola spongiae]|uniref:Gfo/Idh/MocA family oxidoreductase n=1 Tax=Pseudooceanicola spongiae TaxID=2613965 RepID=A0A7L9WLZ3_9RHOB|nr:Gfo/Idh/MocA family oxidoreductase [Pseudooceanicola spongiae]QOL80953.1 gfo/Idh/MocA family oxidoreductase [Pseudooceanicola spongiae]
MSRFDGRSGPIRLGMVGGGQGAMIGSVHRIAARLDGDYTLVAGALSSTPERAQASGRELGLAEDRIYDDFTAMAIREARLKDGIEAVAIVTPNHMHLPAAREFLKRGIHVICDKPMTSTLADAKKLQAAAEKSDALFVLTHTYSGYPMVREAQARIKAGELGEIRLVQVEYAQDWLAEAPAPDNKQAAWRTDPARSGVGGATADIGTHAWHLARFMTGLVPEKISADLQSFVPGRALDDNAHVMMRFEGGARGTLWCSQVAAGQENSLRIRVYGTKAGLEWEQEHPNHLAITPLGGARTILSRGLAQNGAAASRMTRVPPGHPEGYFEAFANLYREAATAIRAHRTGAEVPGDVIFPSIADGVEGVAFVEACVRSSSRDGKWVSL